MKVYSKQILDIEAFRAYAISITIVAHLGELIPDWSVWASYFWLGGGVDLFFVVSGFLITRQLLVALEANESFWIYARSFWVRRIFRLWPAALFWSVLVVLVSAFFNVSRSFGSHEVVVQSWFYGVINSENIYISVCTRSTAPCGETPLWHYWSLSLEEQFYLLLPFFLFFCPYRKHLILPFLVIALLQTFSVRPWGDLLWFIRSDALLYGTIIALGWHYYSDILNSVFARGSRRLWQALILCLAILLIVLSRQEITPYYMGVVATVCGVMVLIVSGDANLITSRVVAKRLALYIGSRSYSIYLVHFPVLIVFREIILSNKFIDMTRISQQVMTVILALIITTLFSEFSFQVIESPMRRFGRSFSRKNKLISTPTDQV